MRRAVALLALLSLGLLAACGEEPLERALDEDGELPGEEPSDEDDGLPDADVEVRVRSDEDAAPKEYGLRCGDAPRWVGERPEAVADVEAEEVCDGLRDRIRAAAEALRAEVCTQEYGGPQTAEVRGELSGEEFALDLHRRDGCGIGAWEALQPLLGAAEGDLGEELEE